jgi:hypothetical protein
VACLLALAWVARDAERRADAAAAQAVRHDARAIEAFARYAALDGTRERGLALRVAMAILRTLRLASHREPAQRCADFRSAAARPG